MVGWSSPQQTRDELADQGRTCTEALDARDDEVELEGEREDERTAACLAEV
jgi:hypothetical protein